MVVDKTEIQACIHEPRIKPTTRMFHGSYGYHHILPNHVVKAIEPQEASVENFVKCIFGSHEKPSKISLMLPNREEIDHPTLMLKSQLSEALLSQVVKKYTSEDVCCWKDLKSSPPQIDSIKISTPTILMFQMMSASENPASGFSQMISQFNKQTGEDTTIFSELCYVLTKQTCGLVWI